MDQKTPSDELPSERRARAPKKTPELIPLCHPLTLTHIDLDLAAADHLSADHCGVEITGIACTKGRTGVEMEALTAVTIALLTVYDMAKAIDRGMYFNRIGLLHKSGGKSGTFDKEAVEAGK